MAPALTATESFVAVVSRVVKDVKVFPSGAQIAEILCLKIVLDVFMDHFVKIASLKKDRIHGGPDEPQVLYGRCYDSDDY